MHKCKWICPQENNWLFNGFICNKTIITTNCLWSYHHNYNLSMAFVAKLINIKKENHNETNRFVLW